MVLSFMLYFHRKYIHSLVCLFVWLVMGRISCNSGWSQTQLADKACLKLLICLPPPLKFWDHRQAPPHRAGVSDGKHLYPLCSPFSC